MLRPERPSPLLSRRHRARAPSPRAPPGPHRARPRTRGPRAGRVRTARFPRNPLRLRLRVGGGASRPLLSGSGTKTRRSSVGRASPLVSRPSRGSRRRSGCGGSARSSSRAAGRPAATGSASEPPRLPAPESRNVSICCWFIWSRSSPRKGPAKISESCMASLHHCRCGWRRRLFAPPPISALSAMATTARATRWPPETAWPPMIDHQSNMALKDGTANSRVGNTGGKRPS